MVLKRSLTNLRFFALFGFFTISFISVLIVVYTFVPSIVDVNLNLPKIKLFVV